MTREVLRLLEPGMGVTIQDSGRRGWRRYGVPASGAMDDHAAMWGNLLLENPTAAPVLEMLFQGMEFVAMREVWIAVTGADVEANVPLWRVVRLKEGQTVRFERNRSGVWIYLAVEDGFEAEKQLGSASVCARGGLGSPLEPGTVLRQAAGKPFTLPSGVAGRVAPWTEVRDYTAPPRLRVWPGPQWDWFGKEDRERLFSEEWRVSSRSDRVGYRLEGPALKPRKGELTSEPVRLGSIQVPAGGEPIVTMRDGPTVGGYPKIGLVDPEDLSWLAQTRSGEAVRFQLAHEI